MLGPRFPDRVPGEGQLLCLIHTVSSHPREGAMGLTESLEELGMDPLMVQRHIVECRREDTVRPCPWRCPGQGMGAV